MYMYSIEEKALLDNVSWSKIARTKKPLKKAATIIEDCALIDHTHYE